LYSARIAKSLGQRVGVWTSCGELPEDDVFAQMQVVGNTSPETTVFTHLIDRSTGHREFEVGPFAPALNSELLPIEWKSADTVMICPVWHEVTPDMVSLFESDHVGLIPQGWFRKMDVGGTVRTVPSRWTKLPRRMDLTVVSVDDIAHDPGAWNWIKKESRVAVRTMSRDGHLVSIEGVEKVVTPPYVSKDVDPTGAGDVFATAMLIALKDGADPVEASRFGSVAASFAVEKVGAKELPTREMVQERLRCAALFYPPARH
jgi:sugar/nucleoside kinase (ribokinase family)